MSGWTNRGKYMALKRLFDGTALPTNYYAALCTSASVPTADTNTLGDLTQVSTGNGYTDGGDQLTLNSTDFRVDAEDDVGNLGSIKVGPVAGVQWTASGGTLPASDSARYMVLTDDNGTVASREVYFYWDLASDRQVSDGQILTVLDADIRITE